ncbi:MAG: hypothetical protein OEW00_10850 [candidate division Zixibacteria bacterium]|nr:hypothetical protein [candidate division Zixibacteria bacterium]
MIHPRFSCIRVALMSLVVIGLTACLAVTAGAKDIKSKLRVPEAGITQMITLKDGSTLAGRIKAVGETEITFAAQVGDMTIPIDQITEIKEISADKIREGKYWFPNPNRTRLYFAPTGRMLKAGQGYFSDIYVLFPSVNFGITDNFTLGGGFSLFPGLDVSEQLFYISPKIGADMTEKLSVAGSALIVRLPSDQLDIEDKKDDATVIGVLFGSATIGSDDASLTGGLGFGYVDDDIADKPAVLVGGEYRLARRMSFVSENWVFPEVDQPIISYGVRFFGESIAVDLAFFNILDNDAIFPGIPYIDFVWNF